MRLIRAPRLRSIRFEPIRPVAMRVHLIAFVFSVVASSSLSAQSLADVARQDGPRRQGSGASKTYTNKDLKPVRQPPADAAAPAGADTQAPAADKAADETTKAASGQASTVADGKAADQKPAGDTEVKDQAYWAKRLTDLREQLDRDQTFADALQSRINVLTMDFINRDDPVQRDQIERDRTRAIVELERLKKTVEDDKKAIADLEEEARRAGVPAGWLR